MEVSVRCDKLPQPFSLQVEPTSTIGALLDQICGKIDLDAAFKDAIIVKRGFPPRPATLTKEQTLQEAGFSAREKLIVSVDDEMVEKLRAERDANMDPVEAQ